jgi:hypothetical protein
MKILKQIVFIFFLGQVCTNIQAQEEQLQKQTINDGSINDQFEFVMKKSYNWKDEKRQSYEVIKRDMILTLKNHTLDSLNALQTKLDSTKNTVSDQKNEINILKTDLAKTQDKLDSVNKEKDSMVLLGLQMSKLMYNLLMWSIIAVLLILLLTFVYKFKRSNVLTKASKSDLTELEAEFEEHRRIALEREQKVRRMLQDEINKKDS